MSGAVLSAVPKQLPNAQITVDWFDIVPTFTRAVDAVRKAKNLVTPLPKHLRWAVLKRGKADRLTANQFKAMADMMAQALDTATAWRIKERLRWVRLARGLRATGWRITRFIDYAFQLLGESHILRPMRHPLQTLRTHAKRIALRWPPTYDNVRLAGLNGLFQASRARPRIPQPENFKIKIYMGGRPADAMLKSI